MEKFDFATLFDLGNLFWTLDSSELEKLEYFLSDMSYFVHSFRLRLQS